MVFPQGTLVDLGLHVVGPRRRHLAAVVPEALRGAAEAHVIRLGDPDADLFRGRFPWENHGKPRENHGKIMGKMYGMGKYGGYGGFTWLKLRNWR